MNVKSMYKYGVCFLLTLVVFCGITTSKSEAAKLIANGVTDQSISVVILNSDGDPNSDLIVNTFDVYIQRDGAHPQSSGHTLTAHTNPYDAHADWYGYHMGNGLLRIDIADANLSDGAGELLTYIVRSTASDANSYYEVQLTPPVDAVAISGDTTTADNLQTMTTNMLIVYSTDFATNYNTTADMWNVNLAAIGADTASMTDLKDFVDTGYDPTNDGVNVWTVRGAAPISTSDINTEVDTALSDIHLDHAFAADYDPASKPGVATALLNELVEDNGSGVSRFTQNALSQAPSISEASWDSTTVSSATDAGTFVIANGVVLDDVYNGFLITVTDADGDNEPEPAFVKDYISATKTVILSTKLSFTPASGDQVRFLAGFGGDYGITLFRK